MNDFLQKHDVKKDLQSVIQQAQEKDRAIKEAELENYQAA